MRRALRDGDRCTYRRRMNRFSESVLQHREEGPSLLSRVAIAFALVSAMIGVAVWIATGSG